MAQLTVGVALDGLPHMLRDIILQSLGAAPEIRVRQLGEQPTFDALVTSLDGSAESHLRHGVAQRVVGVAAEGKHAIVHWLELRARRIEQFPPGWLAAAIREDPVQPAPHLSKGFWLWPFRPRKALPAPEPVQLLEVEDVVQPPPDLPPPDSPSPIPPPPEPVDDGAITCELARLAGRILSARGGGAGSPDQGRSGELNALLRQLAALDSAGRGPRLPDLDRIAALFDLTTDERDLLFLAGAVELDARAARLVALLNSPSRPRPTIGLLTGLERRDHDLVQRLIADGPLLRYGLMALEGDGPVTSRMAAASPAVWPLLFGLERSPPFTTHDLHAPEPDPLPLPEAVEQAMARTAEALAGKPADRILVAVVGDEDVGRAQIARRVAAAVRARAIAVPGADIADDAALAAVAREARLADAAVVLTEPQLVPPPVWRRLTERLEAPLFLVVAPQHLGALALQSRRPLLTVDAPRRDLAHRVRLWTARAPGTWSPEAPADIAARFDFGAARIASALSLARAQAEAEGRDDPTLHDAKAAAERLRDTRLGGSAQRLECIFEPEDIVLPEATQKELELAVAWADHGARLFGEDGPAGGLHAGEGLACLFTGAPGTGKTMAAQIIARRIDFALYRVDLSQVVDKYIGEGEKRISDLFREASRSRVALFFDEADALFGKRTEVKDSHDRYANIAVDHLLQELEAFDGLSILASNMVGNIDAAFMRRIRVRADFPAPDAGDRRRIWDRLLPPRETRNPDIRPELLADPFELVGGEIRNAVYTAHLLAAQERQPLAMRHLTQALARELAKSGRITDFGGLPNTHPRRPALAHKR